jgi:membrane-associated protease RseP (regulator of RpoE activity)
MFFHEMSHAIVARAEDFEINSVGWVVIGILPGAFVEPKGDQMLEEGEVTEANTSSDTGLWDQGNWKSRLKVLCAGSWANYIIGGIFILGFFGMTQTSLIYNVQDDFPAQKAGMNNGTILEINGDSVSTTDQLLDSLENVSVGDEVDFRTSEGNFTVEAVEHPEGEEGGYVGIRFGENRSSVFEDFAYPGFMAWFIGLIGTIAFLNLAIGLFNMLPAKPLDGGQVVDTFVREFKGDEYVHYVNKFSLLVWLVILGTLVGSIVVAVF